MLRTVVLAALAAALIAPAAASHSGAPLRTKAQAEHWVKSAPLRLGDGRIVKRKRSVYCSAVAGSGRGIRFRHFNCLLVPAKGRGYCCIGVHTRAGGRWSYSRRAQS
ncbi:MAG: hypothetical protein ABR583_14495 [Gaiellaceae bacterium]